MATRGGFALPAYEVQNKLLDLSPINSALDSYQDQSNKNAQFGMAQKRDQREQDTFDETKKQRAIDRMGKIADAALNEQDQTRRGAMMGALYKMHPEMPAKLTEQGMDPNDHTSVAQFLKAQTSGYDPQASKKAAADLEYRKAQTGLVKEQAGYYRSKSNPTPAVAPQTSDPLQGAGIDEDGNLIRPGSRGASEPYQPSTPPGFVPKVNVQPSVVPGVSVQTSVPDFSGRMNLGGPQDDIERSMRLDEGRPQGTQVAQATGNYGPGAGYGMSPVQQARQGSFGPSGVTSPEIPNIVTDAGRNRRTDPLATREMQGQRAFDAASPEQQQRLQKFRQDQEMWTGVYKRQPRAGYYYGEDGREMPLTDKNFKGDRENQAVALMNMNKIEAASKKLLSTDYLTRTAAGALNIGETGQAFADMKQGALGIAYALSGKTVAVAEMKNFIEAYGPQPGDGADRIQAKTQRMRDFYNAMLTASRGGESYERAFARAMASTGLKNPDGGPAGAPAVAGATGGPQPNGASPGLSGVSTEDLIRRLNGGR